MRLDIELVNRKLYTTRAKAAAAIHAGLVMVNGAVASKNSMDTRDADDISARPLPYASGRGSLKLAYALDEFQIDVASAACLDIGASTGGFTETLLARGAAHVIAVDVGHGQMIAELQHDPRVTVCEDTDIRGLAPMSAIDLAVIDVSFIRLSDIASAVARWNAPRIIALIKPQFEVHSKNGIVKSDADRQTAISNAVAALSAVGYKNAGIVKSPILGGSGNMEFLGLFVKIDN